MKKPRRHSSSLFAACMLLPMSTSGQPPGSSEVATIRMAFVSPPQESRVMMRWWWFGPSVERTELERELRVMKSAGIGGVEIQPVYPVELDDPPKNFHNAAYLSDEFLDEIGFASKLGKQLGLRVDTTLGSGWPYGGPHTPVTQAAAKLRVERLRVADSETSTAVPSLENGEKLIAAFLVFNDAATQVTTIANGRLKLPGGPPGQRTVLCFISSRTGQQVKRASVGAEGFVLDHYDRAAVEHHLSVVGNRLLKGFGENPPYSVFSDSLEVYGSDWTPELLGEFQKRRGYDLLPHLPELTGEATPQGFAIRHDWGKTLTELAEEHYLIPIRDWAHTHGMLFRSQTYGEPPVILSSNELVDLAEGEHGPEWRGFSAARWASSANHLYGRNVTSTETWTWLHAPSFRATPLDMKTEADLHFIEGVNQLIGHGWPYSPPPAGEPGWRFYAAAAFNDHNPWFPVMPEVMQYLQRISYLMREGKPANDVAIYLPTDDAWAHFRPAESPHQGLHSIDEQMDVLLGPALIPQILNAGYNFDFIDDRAMEKSVIPYSMLIVPGVERMPLATLQRIQAFVRNGGIVIATRRLPSLAPGFQEQAESGQIQRTARELFAASQPNAKFISDEAMLGQTMTSLLTPDFATASAAPAIGFIHRKLQDGELYFFVNTSNTDVNTSANIRVSGLGAEWWDAFSGTGTPAPVHPNGKCTMVPFELAPYESRILVFSHQARKANESVEAKESSERDIGKDWRVTFTGLNETTKMPALRSWTEDEKTRFYSGEAVYEKDVTVSNKARLYVLDFGPGEKIVPSAMPNGMRAWLESPVREIAIVFVNGKRAGSIWHPPYRLDITEFVHPGENQLRIAVSNLAINEMAGRALPDYRLLNLRYGERFVPQGFNDLKPLPSGLLGPVRLIER